MLHRVEDGYGMRGFVRGARNVVCRSLHGVEAMRGRSMAARPRLVGLLLILPTAVQLSGCSTTSSSLPPTSAPPPGAPPAPQTQPGGITAAQRAQGALEGMLMGAMIGLQGGPIGAAIGAGTMLIVGAVTGRSPLGGLGGPSGGGGGGGPYDPDPVEADREAQIEDQLDQEVARGDALEDQIQDELKRQEELLHQIDQQEKTQATASKAVDKTLTEEELAARADPRTAPEAPKDRDLPLSIFDESHTVIPAKTFDNDKDIAVVKRSLDADRDGKTEEIRYFDEKTGVLIRKEQDRDYDGRIDAWTVYDAKGQVVSRKIDGNGDGKPDSWETYAAGRMTEREIDRDGDGVRD